MGLFGLIAACNLNQALFSSQRFRTADGVLSGFRQRRPVSVAASVSLFSRGNLPDERSVGSSGMHGGRWVSLARSTIWCHVDGKACREFFPVGSANLGGSVGEQ